MRFYGWLSAVWLVSLKGREDTWDDHVRTRRRWLSVSPRRGRRRNPACRHLSFRLPVSRNEKMGKQASLVSATLTVLFGYENQVPKPGLCCCRTWTLGTVSCCLSSGGDICQRRDWTGGISAKTLEQSNSNFKNLAFVKYYCVEVLSEHFTCVTSIGLLFYRCDSEGTQRLSDSHS